MLPTHPLRWIALTLCFALLAGCSEQSEQPPSASDTDETTEVIGQADDRSPQTQPISNNAGPDTLSANAPQQNPLSQQDVATLIILNPPPAGSDPLVQRLKQVLKPTEIVKVLPSTNPREIKIQISPIKDLRALANKIPFGKVEGIDDRTRTITVDYEM